MRTTQPNDEQDCPAFTRKDIRLSSQKYLGKQIYFVTICSAGRQSVFSERTIAVWLIENLRSMAADSSFSIHAYCVMPDHAHFLVEGMDDSCDLLTFIAAFKQKTGFSYKQQFAKQLWQLKYYDHILRKADEVELVAAYVWLNPVRKNLCVAPQDYPYSGSQTIDWKNRLAPRRVWTPPWRTDRKDAGLKPGATKT